MLSYIDMNQLFMKKISLILALYIPLSMTAQLPNLTLEEAINRALKNNFGIQVGQNDATIAKNNVTKGNAGFMPTLNAVATESPSLGFLNQKLTFFNIFSVKGKFMDKMNRIFILC